MLTWLFLMIQLLWLTICFQPQLDAHKASKIRKKSSQLGYVSLLCSTLLSTREALTLLELIHWWTRLGIFQWLVLVISSWLEGLPHWWLMHFRVKSTSGYVLTLNYTNATSMHTRFSMVCISYFVWSSKVMVWLFGSWRNFSLLLLLVVLFLLEINLTVYFESWN